MDKTILQKNIRIKTETYHANVICHPKGAPSYESNHTVICSEKCSLFSHLDDCELNFSNGFMRHEKGDTAYSCIIPGPRCPGDGTYDIVLEKKD